MQRVLLAMTTTTYKAHAFLQAALRLGADVVVASERSQALAGLNPTGNLTLAFTDLEAAARHVEEFAGRAPLAAVVAADDDGVVLSAHLSHRLGLAHNAVAAAQTARNKLATRVALRDAGLQTPGFEAFRLSESPRVARRVRYPCVVKPLLLSASRGVIRADDPRSFESACARLRDMHHDPDDSDTALVEDFIPGEEVALEGILDRGQLRTLALFDKPDPLDGPYFEETLYVTPSRHPQATRDAIEATARQALAAIGLTHGPVHAELRFNDRGVWFLEAAPRSIGGLCARALRFGDGGEVSLEELILRHALGREWRALEREPRASGVMMIPIPRPGILHRVEGLDEAARVPAVEEIRITIARGQRVSPPPEGGRYLGFIFARAEGADAVEHALRTSHSKLRIDIETPEPAEPSHSALGRERRK